MNVSEFQEAFETLVYRLGPDDVRFVFSLSAGILDMAQTTTPEAVSTLGHVCDLLNTDRRAAAMEAIRDWQARRLLAQALPGWGENDHGHTTSPEV